jgi:hypothetical protein
MEGKSSKLIELPVAIPFYVHLSISEAIGHHKTGKITPKVIGMLLFPRIKNIVLSDEIPLADPDSESYRSTVRLRSSSI